MKLAFLLIVLLLARPAISAEVSLRQSEGDRGASISFKGAIDWNSVARLRTLLAQVARQNSGDKGPLIELTSGGGDVEAAIAAGRAIRGARGVVLVDTTSDGSSANCVSACIFMYAGGVDRWNLGGVAVHSFFIDSTGATYEQVVAARTRIESSIRAFLREMNVSPELYEIALVVPASRIRVLTSEELERLGLGRYDPTYLDYMVGQAAARYGVDKAVYLSRYRSIDAKCTAPKRPTWPGRAPSSESLAEYQIRMREYETRELPNYHACSEQVLSGKK